MSKRIKPKSSKRAPRPRIVEAARERFARTFDLAADSTGSCLYWAATIIVVAAEHGVRLAPQAGSASWRIVPDAEDDGVCATHFSYVWEGETGMRLHDDGTVTLPEIHVWAGDPKRQEIVDLSTGFQPTQCLVTAGMEWRTPHPPAYVWCRPDRLPCGIYEPNREATLFAASLMERDLFAQLRRTR
jgi:hypothetical protein